MAKALQYLRKLWRTRWTEDVAEDSVDYVRITIREFSVYAFFLIFLGVATFGSTDIELYNISTQIRHLFVETGDDPKPAFKDIASMEDFWDYMEGPFVKGLYWLPKDRLLGRPGFVLYENRILGLSRLRQLRVQEEECQVDNKDLHGRHSCFGDYSGDSKQRRFDEPGETNLTAWDYRSSDELGGSSISGQVDKYDGSGFVQNLPKDRDAALAVLEELKEARWIDRATRAVFVDFTLYNSNNNIFITVSLLVEFVQTGGALPTATIRTVKLIKYVTTFDYFVLTCEIIFVLFIFYYIVEEAIEIRKHGFKYVFSLNGILDILIILIAICSASFDIYSTMEVFDKLDNLLADPNTYAEFNYLTTWKSYFNKASAVMVFFAWTKVLGFMSFNKILVELSSTISNSVYELLSFFGIFCVIFFMFAHTGYILFGRVYDSFNNVTNSVMALFNIMLGDFDFQAMREAQFILGPIYFFIFVVFVFFVLLNFFLAIINETYREIKDDKAECKKLNVFEFMKENYLGFVKKLKRRKVEPGISDAIGTMDQEKENVLSDTEMRMFLKSKGYAKAEIEATLDSRGRHDDDIIEEVENETETVEKSERSAAAMSQRTHKSSEEQQEASEEPEEENFAPQFEQLQGRVGRIEQMMEHASSKIDALLNKFDDYETDRLSKLKVMNNVLIQMKFKEDPNGKRDEFEMLLFDELKILNEHFIG